MQGHGYTQPVRQAPPTGLLVFLRVLFVAISVMSIGFLMWAMMLRLALVTRKTLDWWLFAGVFVVEVLVVWLLGSESGDEIHTPGGWAGLLLLLGTLVASVAYYLAADIRHFQQLRHSGYDPRQPPSPAYGYPQSGLQPQPPYNAQTVPQSSTPHNPLPGPGLRTPVPQPPGPSDAVLHSPVPPPPPQRPAPARIDQVRAELDELSDYLRRHDGNHEGGR
ncbi:hypothetical protein [Streptomyces sp. NPDC050287]|uniref:hypothetical protein n=1 Tax=Streptomyces sp. NPDC050287 TaxID=3365608 RepID=UPI0037B2DA4B